jgi:hypothetical protein
MIVIILIAAIFALIVSSSVPDFSRTSAAASAYYSVVDYELEGRG